MRTIEDIQADLRALAQELEQLKKKDTPATELDMGKIASVAERNPIPKHPLASVQDSHTKKNYLIPLLAVSQYAGDKLEESLLYAHRIAHGMHYLSGRQTLREEYLASMTLSFEQLDECTHLFQDDPLRLMLVLEMLVMAGTYSDAGKKDALEYIARMCMLLKLSKDEITFLGNMAAVILTQDPNNYKCAVRNDYSLFDGYLNNIKFPCKLVYPNKRLIQPTAKVSDKLCMLSRVCFELNQDRGTLLCKCTYKKFLSTSFFGMMNTSLATNDDSYKLTYATFTENITHNTFLFRKNIVICFNGNRDTKEEVLGAIRNALSEPIGVEAHPLAGESYAWKWFNEHK